MDTLDTSKQSRIESSSKNLLYLERWPGIMGLHKATISVLQ